MRQESTNIYQKGQASSRPRISFFFLLLLLLTQLLLDWTLTRCPPINDYLFSRIQREREFFFACPWDTWQTAAPFCPCCCRHTKGGHKKGRLAIKMATNIFLFHRTNGWMSTDRDFSWFLAQLGYFSGRVGTQTMWCGNPDWWRRLIISQTSFFSWPL